VTYNSVLPVSDWEHDLRIETPQRWANPDMEVSWRERLEIALLKIAGCEHALPLLGGYMEESGNTYVQCAIRCRLCNVSVYLGSKNVG
jgi:hypothetical protein